MTWAVFRDASFDETSCRSDLRQGRTAPLDRWRRSRGWSFSASSDADCATMLTECLLATACIFRQSKPSPLSALSLSLCRPLRLAIEHVAARLQILSLCARQPHCGRSRNADSPSARRGASKAFFAYVVAPCPHRGVAWKGRLAKISRAESSRFQAPAPEMWTRASRAAGATAAQEARRNSTASPC